MTSSPVYDEDILLWSEQQAEIVRRLGRTRRDLPNEFDVENVAEEIESVGRSELAAVESFLRLLMLHLIKIASARGSPVVLHWRDEARNFRAEAIARFAPSMAQKIDVEKAWRVASAQARASFTDRGNPVPTLSESCPWTVEELVRDELDLEGLLSVLDRNDNPIET